MKAKFVNEKMERGKKPVGLDSSEGVDQLIKRWEAKGLKFGWMFFSGDEMDKRREFFSKYYSYIEKYLNKVHEAGVSWDKITMWGDHLSVKTYRVAKGNWSLFHCLTKEDAEMLISILEGITTGNQTFNIEEDTDHINLSDKIHSESDPEHRKWQEAYDKKRGKTRRTDLDFLDKIKETRKKLKSIK